jgi:hypothetical protein
MRRRGVVLCEREGTVIEFEIPGNRPQDFLDLNNNLKFKLPVTVTGAVGFKILPVQVFLDRGCAPTREAKNEGDL